MRNETWLIAVVSCVVMLSAQPRLQTDRTAFEVASIKPTKIADKAFLQVYPGGRLQVVNLPLRSLVARAWHVQGDQVDGGPDWARSEGFDIDAKVEGNPSATQVLDMLQALLTERFGLSVRREKRERAIYELRMARSDRALGPDLQAASDSNCVSLAAITGDNKQNACGVLFSPTGHWSGRGVTIASMLTPLMRTTGRVVVDRTGLDGKYDLELQWTDLAGILQGNPDANRLTDGPSFFTALQEQLGLKLEAAHGPVDQIVIERAQRPTPN